VEKPSLARQTTLGSLFAALALFGSVATAAPAQAECVHHAHRSAAHSHRGAGHHAGTRRAAASSHAVARPAESADSADQPDAPDLPEMQVLKGPGFDTCRAPSLATMQAWYDSSAYRAVGIYIGGRNRACGGGHLTADWVSGASAQGWGLIPVYVGLQAPCVLQKGLAKMRAAHAEQEGAADAADAAARAQGYGLQPGSPIYFDLEAFNHGNRGCVSVVLAYIGAWTSELHADGYYSAVYGSAASGMATLTRAVASRPSFDPPDAIWIARWDRRPKTADSSVPRDVWAHHQRIKQYRGGHVERHGGVGIDIDSDYVDGPVALVY